jgi:hypothetical protein
MRDHVRLLFGLIAIALAIPGAAEEGKVGIVLLHGKQSPVPGPVGSLAEKLRGAHYLVATPEMPWSRDRIYGASLREFHGFQYGQDFLLPGERKELSQLFRSRRPGRDAGECCSHSIGDCDSVGRRDQRSSDARQRLRLRQGSASPEEHVCRRGCRSLASSGCGSRPGPGVVAKPGSVIEADSPGAASFEVIGQRLEYRWIGPRPGDAPTIVFLHE